MRKLKIFREWSMSDTEVAMNKWLEQNKDATIISFNPVIKGDYFYIFVLYTYEES